MRKYSDINIEDYECIFKYEGYIKGFKKSYDLSKVSIVNIVNDFEKELKEFLADAKAVLYIVSINDKTSLKTLEPLHDIFWNHANNDTEIIFTTSSINDKDIVEINIVLTGI